MRPCLNLCYDCVYSFVEQKRFICMKGNFNVKASDGLLFVPLDYDCSDFEQKEIIEESLNDRNADCH